MGKYAQIVIGPAGCGKSTYCNTLYEHCQAIGRSVHIVNLEDVMEEMQLGPNGGLLYCMEYLEENLDDWMDEQLSSYGDDDYLVFDCPGQIELYNHLSTFRTFVDFLKRDGWSVCAVYCIDCHFITDVTKFIAGSLQALSAMVKLELPHVNILTKMDICESKKEIEEFLIPESNTLLHRLSASTGPRFAGLNKAVASLLDEFSLISFVPLDMTDEESIGEVLTHIDMAIQYGEDADVKIRDEPDEEPADDAQ
eukprot:gene9787-7670_t